MQRRKVKTRQSCGCNHANVRAVRTILESVFMRGQLPSRLAEKDRKLVLRQLVRAKRNGNGVVDYGLTLQGREVLIDLIDPS